MCSHNGSSSQAVHMMLRPFLDACFPLCYPLMCCDTQYPRKEQPLAVSITWLGHDSFKVKGSHTIYIDPWKLPAGQEPADIILVTHEHFDHFSKEDVQKLRKAGTVVVSTEAVTKDARGETKAVKPGDTIEVKGITIQAVAAYNTNKFREPGVAFHPKQDNKLGFVVTTDGHTIYHAGDTDVIPEMDDIRPDVALLPVSGTY